MTIAADRTGEMQKTSESEGVYWYSWVFFLALESACQKLLVARVLPRVN